MTNLPATQLALHDDGNNTDLFRVIIPGIDTNVSIVSLVYSVGWMISCQIYFFLNQEDNLSGCKTLNLIIFQNRVPACEIVNDPNLYLIYPLLWTDSELGCRTGHGNEHGPNALL